jgi:hypothetical protein
MFRTVFLSIIRSSKLYVQQQVYVKQILYAKQILYVKQIPVAVCTVLSS